MPVRHHRARSFSGTAARAGRCIFAALLGTLVAGPVLAGDAGQAFARMEQRLLDSDFLLAFEIVSSGAYEADFTGTVEIRGPADVSLRADGKFAGEQAAIRLHSTDGAMSGGNGDAAFAGPTPPAMRDALVLGFTRMGLLHNLAVMSAGTPPDRAAGGIRDWVQAGNLRPGQPAVIEGVPAKTLHFDVLVDGAVAATATLWLRVDSGLPLRREQVVDFDGSEMRVVESYRSLTTHPR